MPNYTMHHKPYIDLWHPPVNILAFISGIIVVNLAYWTSAYLLHKIVQVLVNINTWIISYYINGTVDETNQYKMDREAVRAIILRGPITGLLCNYSCSNLFITLLVQY